MSSADALARLSEVCRTELTTRLGFSRDDIAPWEDVDRRLTQLDWKEYSSLYGNIQRFHMILDVEWKRVLTPEQFRGTAAVFQRTQ